MLLQIHANVYTLLFYEDSFSLKEAAECYYYLSVR